MATKFTYKDFLDNCERIKRATPINVNESMKLKQDRIKDVKANYRVFFEYYFKDYAKAKCSWFQVFVANLLLKYKVIFIVLEWFRGSAKSTHADLGYPLWLMINDELKTMLLVGQNEKKAFRLLADIQAQLSSNQRFINDFGDQVKYGSWQEGEFITKQGCAFYAIGIGQSPRGTRNEANRPDYIVVDDADTKQLSKNQARIDEYTDWINGDLMGCFDIGNERFLLVNNRPFKCSILGKMISERFRGAIKHSIKKMFPKASAPTAIGYQVAGDWHHLKVNACDRNFEPTWAEKYTVAYWKKKCANSVMRIWSGEYLNTPITEGKLFKAKHIKYKKMLPLKDYDHLVAYCDPSWKNTASSDYKAIALWGKKGRELHKIKQFCRQCGTVEMVQWFYDLHESLPEEVTVDYYMEANFMQDTILDDFADEGDSRAYQLPIRGDYRKKPDKFQRIEATQPLYERGFLFYNSDLQNDVDMGAATDQLLAIEPGYQTPDDGPDADEGAIHILQKVGRTKSTGGMRIGKRPAKSY
jgi:hypothetical protein